MIPSPQSQPAGRSRSGKPLPPSTPCYPADTIRSPQQLGAQGSRSTEQRGSASILTMLHPPPGFAGSSACPGCAATTYRASAAKALAAASPTRAPHRMPEAGTSWPLGAWSSSSSNSRCCAAPIAPPSVVACAAVSNFCSLASLLYGPLSVSVFNMVGVNSPWNRMPEPVAVRQPWSPHLTPLLRAARCRDPPPPPPPPLSTRSHFLSIGPVSLSPSC